MACTCDHAAQLTPPAPASTTATHPAPAFRFDAGLRARLETNLACLQRITCPLDGRRHAAVAVVVVDSDAGNRTARASGTAASRTAASGTAASGTAASGTAGEAAVLVTRRAVGLAAHAGQWALPGGRLEPRESALDAARRELAEELGLDLGPAAVMGVLDDYPTRSGYVITPFVLWGGANPQLSPDSQEVRSVHRISFRELCRPDSPRFITIPESDRPVVQLPVGDNFIHAPTGAVLLQFRRAAIEGVAERVAGYEQPVFAWR